MLSTSLQSYTVGAARGGGGSTELGGLYVNRAVLFVGHQDFAVGTAAVGSIYCPWAGVALAAVGSIYCPRANTHSSLHIEIRAITAYPTNKLIGVASLLTPVLPPHAPEKRRSKQQMKRL